MKPVNDSDEFVELMASFQGRLYGYILTLLANPDAANDVLQETNLVLWRKSGEFQMGTSFKAWSFRIANFQVMAFRQRKVRDRLVFDDSTFDTLVTEVERVDSAYDARRSALEVCITKLSERQQSLIARRYHRGLTVESIGEELQQNANAIAQALFRARKNLLACIRRTIQAEGQAT